MCAALTVEWNASSRHYTYTASVYCVMQSMHWADTRRVVITPRDCHYSSSSSSSSEHRVLSCPYHIRRKVGVFLNLLQLSCRRSAKSTRRWPVQLRQLDWTGPRALRWRKTTAVHLIVRRSRPSSFFSTVQSSVCALQVSLLHRGIVQLSVTLTNIKDMTMSS